MKSLFNVSTLCMLAVLYGAVAPARLAAQSFEGVVHYDIEVELQLPPDADENARKFAPQLLAMMQQMIGSECSYYFKPGEFKVTSNGAHPEEIYKAAQNAMFRLDEEEGVYKEFTLEQTLGKLKEVKHSDETAVVLDRTCKKVEFHFEDNIAVYWYDPTLKLDPDEFAKIERDNWAAMVKECGALPLKFSIGSPQEMTATFTARQIEQKTLDDAEFELREGYEVDSGTADFAREYDEKSSSFRRVEMFNLISMELPEILLKDEIDPLEETLVLENLLYGVGITAIRYSKDEYDYQTVRNEGVEQALAAVSDFQTTLDQTVEIPGVVSARQINGHGDFDEESVIYYKLYVIELKSDTLIIVAESWDFEIDDHEQHMDRILQSIELL